MDYSDLGLQSNLIKYTSPLANLVDPESQIEDSTIRGVKLVSKSVNLQKLYGQDLELGGSSNISGKVRVYSDAMAEKVRVSADGIVIAGGAWLQFASNFATEPTMTIGYGGIEVGTPDEMITDSYLGANNNIINQFIKNPLFGNTGTWQILDPDSNKVFEIDKTGKIITGSIANADHATTADTATNADHATVADTATHSDTATNATHSDTAGVAVASQSLVDLFDDNRLIYSYLDGNIKFATTDNPPVMKTAIVSTSSGYRELYCTESPEVWFMDFCENREKIDPLFLEATEKPYHFIKCDDREYQVWGKRKGAGEKRFGGRTEEEFRNNNLFWNLPNILKSYQKKLDIIKKS